MNMANQASEFLSSLAQKVADSDAKANADLADIMAGRPFKKQAAPKAASAAPADAPAAKKPRARRKPAAKKDS